MPKTIKQTIQFAAQPHEVHEALMDASKQMRFTGAGAAISREVGGNFATYDGGIGGVNLELVPDAKIVQAWRCTADQWPEEHYSKLSISLEPAGNGHTRLMMVHEEVPEASYETCDNGWREALLEQDEIGVRLVREALVMATNAFDQIAARLTRDERVVEAKMFDARALKVGGKVFAMFVRGTLVVKLPRTRVESFVASGHGQPFDPGHGRVMKEWVSLDPRTAHDWFSLAEEARDFVSRGR